MSARGEQVGEARMRQMLAALPAYAVMIDREYRYLWVNRLDPCRSDQVIGKTIHDFVPPDSLPLVLSKLQQAWETGRNTHYETQGNAHGEHNAWYRTTIVPLPAEDPREARALLLSSDITQQRSAEQALRESEQRFRNLIESSPDVISMFDDQLRLTYLNKEPRADTGLTARDLMGVPLSQIVHPEDYPLAERNVRHCLATGEAVSYEARGAQQPLRFYVCRVLRLEGGVDELPKALVTSTDVTEKLQAEAERTSLEQQLQRAQKLETIGRLAGGIAHDFNNVLLVIQSQLEFAKEAIARGEDPSEELDGIRSATDKTSRMIRQLLTVGRRQPSIRKDMDLGDVVQEMCPLIRRALPASVDVRVERGQRPVPIHIDRSQLEQLLLNLCINAGDAIEGSGRVTIMVERRNGSAVLRIVDTGCGMTEEVAAAAFEPFFTTKEPGKGSGLGLSMVQSIVSQNDGRIELSTSVGKGTSVEVELPLVQHNEAAPETEPPSAAEILRGSATVLLVEDEPSVRTVVTRMLERAGYRVLVAGDGQEAVDRFAQHSQEIALVLMDVVMPTLGGKEAYERIRALRPDVKVLFTSGYTADVLPRDYLEAHNLTVLSKPYRPRELLQAVATALGA